MLGAIEGEPRHGPVQSGERMRHRGRLSGSGACAHDDDRVSIELVADLGRHTLARNSMDVGFRDDQLAPDDAANASRG
ncbi:ATPase AAA [Nocardioides sp. PD653]|nr:ATPase AAA [Nocardioides sp. PD653-B2]GAW53708.1 ATPase AAA [Nocardioides sp. PD653]